MLRILLADDEPLVLIGLQGMLEWEKLGYTVCGTARNGRIAQELIEREQPDIVIADVKMPVMDGLDLARACHEKGPLPVFIMLTSSEDFSYARRAIEAGVAEILRAGQHDKDGQGPFFVAGPGQVQPVHHRHLDVGDDDVGLLDRKSTRLNSSHVD